MSLMGSAALRIGIVTATYTPSKNGVATSTALFVRGLRALGHEVRVFAPRHPDEVPEEGVIRLPGLQVSSPPDYPLLLPVGPMARQSLPVHDLDVVHTMHPFVAGQIALGWARRAGAPLVFTAHTQYHAYVHYAPTPAGLTTWVVKHHVRAFAGEADAVLAPGSAMIETLREYGYPGEVLRFPNPVDTATATALPDPALRARFGIPAAAPLLLYVGRMGNEKGLPLLLEAFSELRRIRPEAHLLMLGDGPLREPLAAQRPPQVHWAGAVPHAEVPRWLKSADLFVSASTSEVLPMTFLEALSADLPVVAVDSAAARDLLGGELDAISAVDRQALAHKALQHLDASERQQRLPAIRAVAAAHAVERRCEALVALYRERIAGGTGAGADRAL